MQESHEFVVGPLLRFFVQRREPFGLQSGDFGADVGDLEGEVMDALAAFLQEFGNRAVGAGGLEEFDFRFARLEKRRGHALRFDGFLLVGFGVEEPGKQGVGGIEVLDGDADVFDVFHGKKLTAKARRFTQRSQGCGSCCSFGKLFNPVKS